MYNAKNFHMFNKVWKKYAGRWARKYGKNIPCKVGLLVNVDESPELIEELLFCKSSQWSKFVHYYLDNLHHKQIRFEDGDDGLAMFKGFHLTNLGIFYILEFKGQLGQVHSSMLAFINNTNQK